MVRRTAIAALLGVILACTVAGLASAASIQAYKYLVDGFCQALVYSDGAVLMSGTTRASQPVDRISVVVHLQYWNGSRWVSLVTKSYSASNTWNISGAFENIIAPGYWYRGYCEHSLSESGLTEFGTSATDPFTR